MAYGDNEQNLPTKAAGWAGGILVFLLSKFLRGNFLAPLAFSVLFVLLLRKTRTDPFNLSMMQGLALGQAGWFILGVLFVPSMWATVVPDIVLTIVLVGWLLMRVSIAPIVMIFLYELASLAINATMLLSADTSSNTFRALIVHCLWRVMVIGFGIAYLVADRRKRDDAGIASVFE